MKTIKLYILVMMVLFPFYQLSGQTQPPSNPQYSFYGDYDLSTLVSKTANDMEKSTEIARYILIVMLNDADEKYLIDLYRQLYEIEHTSMIFYTTSDQKGLPFLCKDSIKTALDKEVDFGSALVEKNERTANRFQLGFASPITKIDPQIFTETVTSIKLPATDFLTYTSSPDINVKNLAHIDGKDVVDNTLLIDKNGVLIVAAVADYTEYEIPNQVKVIGSGAFRGCTLQTIVLPESIEKIEDAAFAECTNLQSVTIQSKEPISFASNAFGNNISQTLTLYVPKSSLKQYRKSLPSLKKQIKGL